METRHLFTAGGLFLFFFAAGLAYYWPLEVPLIYSPWVKGLSHPEIYADHLSFSEGYFNNAYFNFLKIILFLKNLLNISANSVVAFFGIFSLFFGAIALFFTSRLISDNNRNNIIIILFLSFWFFDISITGFWHCNVLSFGVMHYCIGFIILLFAIYLFCKGNNAFSLILWASLIYLSQSSFLIGLTIPIAAFFLYIIKRNFKSFLVFIPPVLIVLPYFYFYPAHHFEFPVNALWFKMLSGSMFSLYGSLMDWSSVQIILIIMTIIIVLIVGYIVAFKYENNIPAQKLLYLSVASVFLFYGYFFIYDILGIAYPLYFQTAKVIWIISIAAILLFPIFISKFASVQTIILTPLLLNLCIRIQVGKYPGELTPDLSFLLIFSIYIMYLICYDLSNVKKNIYLNFIGFISILLFSIIHFGFTIQFFFYFITAFLFVMNDLTGLYEAKKKLFVHIVFSCLFISFLIINIFPFLQFRVKMNFRSRIDIIQINEFVEVCQFINQSKIKGSVLIPYDQKYLSLYYKHCTRPAVPVFSPESILVFAYDLSIPETIKQAEMNFYGENYFKDLFPDQLLKSRRIMRNRRKKADLNLSARQLNYFREKYDVQMVCRHKVAPIHSKTGKLPHRVLFENKIYILFQLL